MRFFFTINVNKLEINKNETEVGIAVKGKETSS